MYICVEIQCAMSLFRNIKFPIQDLLGKYPVVAVTGPRQSGKTTMLKTEFPDYRYVNLENPDMRSYAEKDPNGFWQRLISL